MQAILKIWSVVKLLRFVFSDQHGSGRTYCRPMAEVSRVRSRLLEILPRMAFVGAGLRAVSFSSTGESSNSGIEVSL